MTITSNPIPNMINGVSQQPETLRLPTQSEDEVNCHGTVVDGLLKRPPLELLAKLANSSTGYASAFTHTINRDATEKYVVIIANGTLKVFTLAGVEKTVAFPNGSAYLGATVPLTSYKATTVADYTFITRTDQVVAMETGLTTARPHEALIHIKAGNYGRTYTVTINGTAVATYTAPDGSASSHGAQIATDYVATDLYNDLVAAGYNTAPWSTTRYNHVIHISNSTTDFSISFTDSQSGTLGVAIKDKVQKFTDLPTVGPDGFAIEVIGEESNAYDSYFVKFEKTDAANSSGIWKETVAGGIEYRIDAATMPHILVREIDGTFTFKEATWGDRIAGAEDSAPNPSFVGNVIEDVYFVKNRLGLCSSENTILSESGEPFNFFPITVTQLLDTAPIDIGSSHVKVSYLRNAHPFNDGVILMSDQTQFRLAGGDIFSPQTVTITPVTEFSANRYCPPVSVGSNLYFASEKGEWSSIYEFYIPSDTDREDADDVCEHVPRYVPANVRKLAASAAEDLIVGFTPDTPDTLYTYKYFFSGREKLQSAWRKWVFDGVTILNCDFIDNWLYIVGIHSGGVYLERMNVQSGYVDDGFTDETKQWLTLLDHKTHSDDAVVSYDAGSETTDITVDWDVGSSTKVVVASPGTEEYPAGYEVNVLSATGDTVTVNGDLTDVPLYIGNVYTQTYTFSPLYIRQNTQRGQLAVTDGRLQVMRMEVTYADTAYFRAEVTPRGRQTYKYAFTGRVIGSNENLTDQLALESGTFSFPVRCRNTDATVKLINDSPWPSKWLSANWTGDFVSTSRTQR